MSEPNFYILDRTLEDLAQLQTKTQLSGQDIANVIAHDPALAASVIFKAIHTPRGRFSSEITTLLQSSMMLGIDPILKIANHLPKAEDELTDKALLLYRLAVGRAVLAGRIGLYIARQRHELDPGQIELASLLATLGELSLWKATIPTMVEFERLRQQPGIHPQQAEYLIFDTDIGDIGLTLAKAWDLPDILQTTMAPHHTMPVRQRSPLLANLLAKHVFFQWRTFGAGNDLRFLAEHLDIPLEHLGRDLDDILEEFEPLAKSHFGMPHLTRLANTSILSEADKPFNPIICMAPQKAWIDIGQEQIKHTSTPEGIIHALLTACYFGLGMDRVIYAKLAHEDKEQILKFEDMLGTEHEYKFLSFEIPVAQTQLFGHLLKKPAAVFFRPEDPKISPLLPISMFRLTHADRFFCLSLFRGSEPIGLLYADRRHPDECLLTDTLFQDFKTLGLTALAKMRQM